MIETLLEIIKRALESGEDVLVSGFGKFSPTLHIQQDEG
jgi:nucleoid DNA-binding protein